MQLPDFFTELVTDYTLQTIVSGAAVLGFISGMIGVWAVLRRQSLMGDAIAHAALPGIALAFIITGMKHPMLFLLGAAATGWLAALWIRIIVINTRVKNDAALAIVMATLFGFGMVLITYIQRMPNAQQAGLESFLFGQAATMLRQDVITIAIIAAIILIFITLFWKEFKLLTFDPQFTRTIGFNTKLLDIFLNTLLVLAIALGLQAVGVVLMSALLIAPAAAARQWTNKLSVMTLLAAAFGAVSGVSGTAISGSIANLPTGPLIVIASVSIVMLSFLFAPQRGLVAQFIAKSKNKKRVALDAMLVNLYHICSQHNNTQRPHSYNILKPLPDFSKTVIKKLSEKKWIHLNEKKEWCLTDEGLIKAKQIIETGGQ
jgi:manganese/zinc/iron transport system permease protein